MVLRLPGHCTDVRFASAGTVSRSRWSSTARHLVLLPEERDVLNPSCSNTVATLEETWNGFAIYIFSILIQRHFLPGWQGPPNCAHSEGGLNFFHVLFSIDFTVFSTPGFCRTFFCGKQKSKVDLRCSCGLSFSQQPRHIETNSEYCWASVADGGPTLHQPCFKASWTAVFSFHRSSGSSQAAFRHSVVAPLDPSMARTALISSPCTFSFSLPCRAFFI